MITLKEKKKSVCVCNNRFAIKKKINSDQDPLELYTRLSIDKIMNKQPSKLRISKIIKLLVYITKKNYFSNQKTCKVLFQFLLIQASQNQYGLALMKNMHSQLISCWVVIWHSILSFTKSSHLSVSQIQPANCFQLQKTCIQSKDEKILFIRGIIHRDIKPENFLVGNDQESSQIYLIDFGIAKYYKILAEHIEFREGKTFIGTTRYASLAAHRGQELARKDDLESLGYVLIYFLKGSLPWQNISAKDDMDKIKQVFALKSSISLIELCGDLPSQLLKYMSYIRNLKFKAKPDYNYLQQLLRKMAAVNKLQMDRKFDWTESLLPKDPPRKGRIEIVQLKFSLKEIKINELMRNSGRHKSVGNESMFQRQNSNVSSSKQSSNRIDYIPSLQFKNNCKKYDVNSPLFEESKRIAGDTQSERIEDLNELEIKLNEDRFYGRRNHMFEWQKIKVKKKEIEIETLLNCEMSDQKEDLTLEEKILAMRNNELVNKFKDDLEKQQQ